MALTWQARKLIDKKVWANGLVTLTYDWRPDFVPGQFATAAMPGVQRPLRRLYTIASAPKETVEIYVVKIEGGYLTPQMIDMPIGSHLMFTDKIKGIFTIDHQPNKENLWLISTGTGLAPYISMLRDELIWQKYNNIILVHGVRDESRLSYRTEFERTAQSKPLVYLPYVTREKSSSAGFGRLTHLLKCGQLERDARCKLSASTSHVMLCGNPSMITDMTQILERQYGLTIHKRRSPGELTVEKYW